MLPPQCRCRRTRRLAVALFVIGCLCWAALSVRILLHGHPPVHTPPLAYSLGSPDWLTVAHGNNTTGPPPLVAAKAAVILMGCNRPDAVVRSLRQLVRNRPPGWKAAYPILVSLDCAHRMTEVAAEKFSSHLAGILRQPDQGVIRVPPRERRLVGYYRIARHYRWALDQVFLRLNYTAAIIVEDDLDTSPDFYAYFDHLGPLMTADPTVWCVSAWNDNGKADLIDANRPDLFYRTDFFPGLGWMLLRRTWLELRSEWPPAYWDDHLRKASISRGRSCIRPEISRSYTFGKVGVSHGQHFDAFLRHIRLNNANFNYTGLSLTHLMKANYEANFTQAVYRLPSAPSVEVAMRLPAHSNGIRVEYTTRESFLSAAKRLGAMADFKHGVPRCSHMGIVPLFHSGRRIFLAPKLPWTGYNVKWKA